MNIFRAINFRLLAILLFSIVAAVGLFGIPPTIAEAVGQNSNQSESRAPVHHKKQVHVSCRQVCLSDYDACKSDGAKRGVHSCRSVRDECFAACPAAQ